jgi:photosystem II stability/assembly factor-like uncharacterized protein
MSKNFYLFLIFAGFLSLGTVRAQWVAEQCPSKNNLNAIFFISGKSGWIAGDYGTILYKSENIWRAYQKPTTNNLNGIFMINEKDGWAVGGKGTIIHFNGKIWNIVESPTKNNLYSVSFSDPENGIAVGQNGVIIVYENRSWKLVERKIRGNLYAISFNNDVAWIGGGLECVNVPIMKLENISGKEFTNSAKLFATITGITMINSNNGWAVGSPSTIMQFNGQQWNKSDLDFSYPSLRSVFFSDINNGISAGYSGTILIYFGSKWTIEKASTSRNLNGTAIIGSYYYVVGDSGTIIMKKMGTNNDLISNPKFKLDEIGIYPNPASELINIVIPGENDYSTFFISITSITGQKVLQKELEFSDVNYPYPLVTRDFKNGIYILKTIVNGKAATGRFVIKH